jgi:hypothetical protein
MQAAGKRMAATSSSTLASLRFDNRFTRILPVDADTSQSIRDPVRNAAAERPDLGD